MPSSEFMNVFVLFPGYYRKVYRMISYLQKEVKVKEEIPSSMTILGKVNCSSVTTLNIWVGKRARK